MTNSNNLTALADRLEKAAERIYDRQWYDESDLMEEAAKALRALERERWKPMETAPKDGTEILICWGTRRGVEGMVVGEWYLGEWVYSHMSSPQTVESDGYIALGWQELPAPPSESETK